MPPQMAEHSRKARERMKTSLIVGKKMSDRQTDEPEEEEKGEEDKPLDPEAVSNALRELADKFAQKPAENAPTQRETDSSRLSKVMSSFSPNTGQPQPPGPQDNSGQTQDKQIRAAVEKVMSERGSSG